MLTRFLGRMLKVEYQATQKFIPFALFLCIITLLVVLNLYIRVGWERVFGFYGSLMVVYLIAKMLLSFFYKTNQAKVPNLSVDIVIPSYNEPPLAVLKTVQSAITQTHPPKKIYFIDDGSPSQASYSAMRKFKLKYDEAKCRHHPELIIHRLDDNQGKRAAQGWAFIRSQADIIATVDSDCTLIGNSIEELIRPFSEKDVTATTGKVKIRNRDANFLAKLIDMRYDNAFRVERAAQSVTNNVLVCSGPLSAYRREIIIENIDHYENQHFLGVKVQAGDDRCLTNYAIAKGKTLLQDSAICYTDAPTKISKFVKQQMRWNRSFFRESIRAVIIGRYKPAVLIWVTLEMTLWIMFGFVVIIALIFQLQSFGYILIVYYFATIFISAYARNVHYVIRHPLMYLAAPAYGILHLILLFPLRLYALATLRSPDWGTRKPAIVHRETYKPSLWHTYVYHMFLFGRGVNRVAQLIIYANKKVFIVFLRPAVFVATYRYRRLALAFHEVYQDEHTRVHQWQSFLSRLDSLSTVQLRLQQKILSRASRASYGQRAVLPSLSVENNRSFQDTLVEAVA